jgi:hypothetical protein
VPALPPVPGTVKLQLHWTVGPDGNAMTVMHWGYTGSAPSASSISSWTVAINAAAALDLAPLIFSGNAYQGCTVTDIASNTGVQITAPAPTPGTRGGETLPAQCAVLLNKHIATRYRGGKPRSYVPFGQAGDLQGDENWSTTFISAVASGWANFTTALTNKTEGSTVFTSETAISYYQGYASPVTHPGGRVTQGSALRTGGPIIYPIVSTSVNPKPATQRRRLQR